MTVGDLLKANAIAALLANPQAVPANPQAVPANPQAVPAPASSPPSLDPALADATRRAQQALGALVNSLATATRSLNRSLSTGGR